MCGGCERWNLTPLEERWEAVEECERLFRDARLRLSTGEIGLAHLGEGLDLVRIGAPQRPEMAAWRYGDQFGRRRRRHLALTVALTGTAAGLAFVGPWAGFATSGAYALFNLGTTANSFYQARRVVARLKLPGEDDPLVVRREALRKVRIARNGDGVLLSVPPDVTSFPFKRYFIPRALRAPDDDPITIDGDGALRAAARLLPAINTSGAGKRDVASALTLLAERGGENEVRLGRLLSHRAIRDARLPRAPGEPLFYSAAMLPAPTRLALEMAAHETTERRALEGELAELEAAWREAEEIAAIADGMFDRDGDAKES